MSYLRFMDSLTHPLMFLSNREAWREAGRGRHCDKEFHKEDTVSISSLSEPTLFVFPSVCLHTMDTEGFNFPHFTDRKCLNEYVLLLKSDFFFYESRIWQILGSCLSDPLIWYFQVSKLKMICNSSRPKYMFPEFWFFTLSSVKFNCWYIVFP